MFGQGLASPVDLSYTEIRGVFAEPQSSIPEHPTLIASSAMSSFPFGTQALYASRCLRCALQVSLKERNLHNAADSHTNFVAFSSICKLVDR